MKVPTEALSTPKFTNYPQIPSLKTAHHVSVTSSPATAHHRLPCITYQPTSLLAFLPSSIITMEASTSDPPKSRFRTSSKLHKDPPASLAARSSLRKPQSTTALRRHPSAPIFPRSQTPGSSHQRARSNQFTSSTSSLEQVSAGHSPVLNTSDVNVAGASAPFTSSRPNRSPTHRFSGERKAHDDLVGKPFDVRGVMNTIEEAAKGTSTYQGAGKRPPPPLLSHTSPDLRSTKHLLRQSSSFNRENRAMEVTPPRSDYSGTISPKRLSDETGSKPGPPTRKKSGFSSFVNSMLGSPRTIKISAPENPVHMIHVGYDNQTGQFTVGGLAASIQSDLF